VLSLTSAFVNLGLSIWLVQSFGLAGVAIGTLIPTSIECLCFVLPYAVRKIGVSWQAVCTEIFLPSVAPVIPMAVILYGLVKFLQPDSYLSILVVGVIGLVVYAVGYLMTGAADSERQILRRLFQKVVRTAQVYLQS
jgi:peptidoglycan biosynthesis protein MviN/MurJ (putative lipid II flippase)